MILDTEGGPIESLVREWAITRITHGEELLQEFDALPNDVEKWRWIIKNHSKGIVIMLDNDDTYGIIENIDDDDEDASLRFQFDDFVGDDGGIFKLFRALGIRCEGV